MFPVEAFQRTIEKFVQIASTMKLPFHLTGGSISSPYGEPRLTQDIDIVISPIVAKNFVNEPLNELSNLDFLYTEPVVRKAILENDVLKLDIYPRELIPGELDRSRSLEIFDGVFLARSIPNRRSLVEAHLDRQGKP